MNCLTMFPSRTGFFLYRIARGCDTQRLTRILLERRSVLMGSYDLGEKVCKGRCVHVTVEDGRRGQCLTKVLGCGL